jgi:Zinc-finger of C2H2 type
MYGTNTNAYLAALSSVEEKNAFLTQAAGQAKFATCQFWSKKIVYQTNMKEQYNVDNNVGDESMIVNDSITDAFIDENINSNDTIGNDVNGVIVDDVVNNAEHTHCNLIIDNLTGNNVHNNSTSDSLIINNLIDNNIIDYSILDNNISDNSTTDNTFIDKIIDNISDNDVTDNLIIDSLADNSIIDEIINDDVIYENISDGNSITINFIGDNKAVNIINTNTDKLVSSIISNKSINKNINNDTIIDKNISAGNKSVNSTSDNNISDNSLIGYITNRSVNNNQNVLKDSSEDSVQLMEEQQPVEQSVDNETLSVLDKKEKFRPFHCELCVQKFFHYYALKKHINLVHDQNLERLYCKICDKTFSSMGYLKRHLHLNHGRKEGTGVKHGKDISDKSALEDQLAQVQLSFDTKLLNAVNASCAIS